MSHSYQTIASTQGHFIAYHQLISKENKPGVIFFGGLMSDMEGAKATALEKHCKQHDHSFIRFDYFGHGQSSGIFQDGTISRWLDDALIVIDQLAKGPQILVGSSLGGWIILLAALQRPERVSGLIGIASAPDFTEDLMWHKFSDKQKAELEKTGLIQLDSDYSDTPYPISKTLIEDGRKHLLLRDTINIQVPIRLLHGMADDDVPYDISIKLAKQLTSDDVLLTLPPKTNHSMSDENDLKLIMETVDKMLASL